MNFKSIVYLNILCLSQLFSNNYDYNQINSFNSSVEKGLNYLRVEFQQHDEPILINNNNTIFQITINSRRNNYEESLMMAFSCIGKIINKRLLLENKVENLFFPSVIIIHCNVPIGRNGSYFKTSSTFIILDNFINGSIDAASFWNEIILSTEYLSDDFYLDQNPSFFDYSVEYENLVASRIAIENKNNPKSANLISMASKAKYIPGLQGQLESVLMNYMKSKHSELMQDVLGSHPSDKQLLRLGKLVFMHIQKPLEILYQIHAMDSMRYIWNGGEYPNSINNYYSKYYKKNPKN